MPGCSVADDLDHGFADPAEGRLQAALRYRMDGSCPAPTGTAGPESAPEIARKSLRLGTLSDRNPGLKVMRPEY